MKLELWLHQATRGLSTASCVKVRIEITEHYREALEEQVAQGRSPAEAELAAVASLGSAAEANRGYRKTLLTPIEEKVLNFYVAHPGLGVTGQKIVRYLALIGLAIETYLLATGSPKGSWLWMLAYVGFVGLSFQTMVTGPEQPAARRLRFFRWAWTVLFLSYFSIFVDEGWLLFLLLGPLNVWQELTWAAIRRKLPREQWPRGIYL